MKQLFFLLTALGVMAFGPASAQTFHTSTFSAGHGWTLNNFNNLNIIPEEPAANVWYVSDQESGKAVGDRGGAGCGNPTLHLGSSTLGDLGAAYDAGGCSAFFGSCATCNAFGIPCRNTDRSAISPNISTVGKTTITLEFNYIHGGTGLLDNAQVIYSINGGTSWILLGNLPKTTCCNGAASCATGCAVAACSGANQGQWALYSTVLPVSCEGISNFRVGLRWYNDDVATGALDPSVAIDDLILSTMPILPIELLKFGASLTPEKQAKLEWITATEINNDYFTLHRSNDGINWFELATVEGAGNSNEVLHYEYIDDETYNGVSYFQLQQTDFDGSYTKSEIVSLSNKRDVYETEFDFSVYPNPSSGTFVLDIIGSLKEKEQVKVYNTIGVCIETLEIEPSSLSTLVLDLNKQPSGVYFIEFTSQGTSKLKRIQKL